MSEQLKVYEVPELEILGTPAEICQISKNDPGADSEGFTNPGPFPGEGS